MDSVSKRMTLPIPHHDIAIVGAGPAGIGQAVMLKHFGINNFVVLDRHGIGSSFLNWPQEMRLITPSFNTTPFGILDLNSVAMKTSVANFLGREHPTGREYASYLAALAKACALPVLAPWEVCSVDADSGPGFLLQGPHGSLRCQFLIWAAGEYQFPNDRPFPGAQHALHNSRVKSFRQLPGREHLVIGAFESGVDAAVHLVSAGRRVTLLSAQPELALRDQDPSRALSPLTRERLEAAIATGRLHIHCGARVTAMQKVNGAWVAHDETGRTWHSPTPPILATGFRRGTGPVEHLFATREDGEILLTDDDESTIAPGLFLSGPLLRHDRHIFCYIYKFRQRFAVVAETLAERLGLPVEDSLLEDCERHQMRLVDLSCCGQECLC